MKREFSENGMRSLFAFCRGAVVVLGCTTLTACATIDARPGPNAAAGELALRQTASANSTAASQAQQTAAPVRRAANSERGAEVAPNSQTGVAPAAYNSATAASGHIDSRVSNAQFLAPSGNANTNQVVRAIHRQNPHSPSPMVKQASNTTATGGLVSGGAAPCHHCGGHGARRRGAVGAHRWSQCPSCTPVTFPGDDTYSVAVDSEMALRYRDEYICDGGDMKLSVYLDKRMVASGLDLEDTVAHYKQQDGKIVVEPSTRTCIYAPRFASVRQVRSLAVNEHSSAADLAARIAGPVLSQANDSAIDLHQPLAPKQSSGATKLHEHAGRNAGVPVTGIAALLELDRDLMPFENLTFVRAGKMLGSEKVRLAKSAQNAITWTGDQAPEAVLDGVPAVVAENVTGLQSQHEYILPKGKPRLRIVKLADRDNAHPGEEVQFTLRFDNIGNQPIKEVVLLDNLAIRLEYIPESAQSTIKAKFSTEPNDGESLVLRWELEEALDVGDGGVIRFKCKVR